MKVRVRDLKEAVTGLLAEDKCKGKNPGLWCNIHKRRKAGKRPKRPGEKGYPKTLDIDEMDEYGLEEADGEWSGLGRGPGRPGVLDRSKKRRRPKSTPYPRVAKAWATMTPGERDELSSTAMEMQVGLHADEAAGYMAGDEDDFSEVIEILGPDCAAAMDSELRDRAARG